MQRLSKFMLLAAFLLVSTSTVYCQTTDEERDLDYIQWVKKHNLKSITLYTTEAENDKADKEFLSDKEEFNRDGKTTHSISNYSGSTFGLPDYEVKFYFDDMGREALYTLHYFVHKKIRAGYDPDTVMIDSVLLDYDDADNVTRETHIKHQYSKEVELSRYAYNADGNLVTKLVQGQSGSYLTQYSYNEEEYLTETKTTKNSAPDMSHKFTYDEKEQLVKIETFEEFTRPYRVWEMEYDDNGHKILQTQIRYGSGGTSRDETIIKFFYDDEGRVIRKQSKDYTVYKNKKGKWNDSSLDRTETISYVMGNNGLYERTITTLDREYNDDIESTTVRYEYEFWD